MLQDVENEGKSEQMLRSVLKCKEIWREFSSMGHRKLHISKLAVLSSDPPRQTLEISRHVRKSGRFDSCNLTVVKCG